MEKGKHERRKVQIFEKYSVLILIATLLMSIGYAEITGIDMQVATNVETTAQKGVFITDITRTEYDGADISLSKINNYLDTTVNSTVVLGSDPGSYITYYVSVYNRSEREQVYIGPFGLTGEDLYDNSKITYEVQGITPYETVLEPGRNYNFTIKFKYTGNDTSDNTLTSRLNFRFMEKPELAITNEGEITGIYPDYAVQEYEFKVCNYNGETINNVALSYGLTAEIQKPFIAKIYDSTGAEVTSSTAIDVAGKNEETGAVSKVDHTYKLKILWDSTNPETDVPYNSAEYAGQTYTAKINLVATPKPNADGDKKYANYTLTQAKDITVKTAPMNLTAEPNNTTIEMTNNRGEINLAVSNNDGNTENPYETKYTISQDNTKYTLYVDETEYANNITEERTIGTGELITLVEKIWLVPKQEVTLNKEETANITITITSPYTNKTETKEIKITDTVPPTKPTITGGSESYLASQTISVSEVSTDVGTGVKNYEYLVNNTEQAIANATGDVTTTQTSQTFNTEYNGYYIWFRAVDAVGNKGEWSNSQKLNVDPNPPTVTANEANVSVIVGTSNDLDRHFTSNNNGLAPITSTVYTDTSNGNTVVENTNSLAVGTHIIKCTVTKENGLQATAEVTIEVKEKGVYGNLYKISDTEYHLIFNSTGAIAEGYTEEQLEQEGANIIDGSTKSGDVSAQPWGGYSENITKVKIEEEIKPNSAKDYFVGLSKVTEIEGIENINTTNTTSMHRMFYGCSSLSSLNVSNFNTTNVTNMQSVFYNCSSLKNLNMSNFTTSNVEDMSFMFYGCSGLTDLNLSTFNTAKVEGMDRMFYGCSGLASINISNFNTTNVANMQSMFYGCSSLTDLDASVLETPSLTNISYMFYNCSSLTDLDLSTFDTSKVDTMEKIFYGCSSLTSLNLNNFDVTGIANMQSVFYKCSNLTSLNLCYFDTSNVTNMSYMFSGCTKLTTIYVSERWSTESVTTSTKMFENCLVLKGAISYDSSKITAEYANYTTGYLTLKNMVVLANKIQKETTEFEDDYGNKIVVPGGFKVLTDLAINVEEGIVIEDPNGNQFVWIPIGDVKKSDGNTVNIELGRYTFDKTNGTETLQQSAENFEEEVSINTHIELTEFRESKFDSSENNNATAYDLKGWITSAKKYGGYYLARVQGSLDGTKGTEEKGKPAVTSQKAQFIGNTAQWLRQGDASIACRNLYAGNEYNNSDFVQCDLTNSYAWDTAIVFIKKCSNNSNFANSFEGNACNIYDMASGDWTTEYSSSYISITGGYPSMTGRAYGNVWTEGEDDQCYVANRGYFFFNDYMGFRGTLTITEINSKTVADNPEIYYGASVNYEDPAGDPNVGWKIFHADGENIYLIADDCIHFDYAPKSSNYELYQYSDYMLSPCDVYKDYIGSASIRDISITDSRIQKWITYVNSDDGKNSEYENIRKVAFMLDSVRWGTKYTNSLYADYAIGGPTLELFIDSCNKLYPSTNIGYSTNSYGYLVGTGGENNSVGINYVTEDELYIQCGEARGYWIASPSGSPTYPCYMCYDGDLNINNFFYDLDQYLGFRPVVCLKSGVTLEKVGDNEYNLIAPPTP